ncbi:MAG: DUF1800 domain-containing protein [Acidobacteriota bacterium]
MSQPPLAPSDAFPGPSPALDRRRLLGLGGRRRAETASRTGQRKAIETVSVPLLVFNRLAFGPRPGDLPAFAALGPDPTSRLTAWVDQQLNPGGLADPLGDSVIGSAAFTTLSKTRQQLWLQHRKNSNYQERIRPREEVERATFLRAIYSSRQLFEVITNFWHDHFSVYSHDSWVQSMFVHYDRDVIRANALGNFRTLLGKVAESTSMLYFLDNYTSTNAGPNENFSRELFELHTLGAENYLGVQPQYQVPVDGDGKPLGYVDADVFESTRAFTGWSVAYTSDSADNGTFLYRDEWHDRFQKSVLGIFLGADAPPLQDGNAVLDALADHPGTARHICRKLCRRLTVDEPPQSLVDTAVATWMAHRASSDQIARVVRSIATAPEFLDGFGEKARRPFEVAVAMIRAVGTHLSFAQAHSESNSFLWRFDSCGQPLFSWPAPDGFPDRRTAWQSVSPRAMTWRLVLWMTDQDNSNDVFMLRILDNVPPSARTSEEIVDYWIARILGRTIDPADRADLISFLSQGISPTFDLPFDTDEDIRERVRALVGLICTTPYFLWK